MKNIKVGNMVRWGNEFYKVIEIDDPTKSEFLYCVDIDGRDVWIRGEDITDVKRGNFDEVTKWLFIVSKYAAKISFLLVLLTILTSLFFLMLWN